MHLDMLRTESNLSLFFYIEGGERMKTKQLVTNSLLLAVGFLLHYVTPAIGLPMQIDFSLITMILVINLNKNSFSTCIAGGIATGIFSGITSKFPMGMIPNIIDKLVTTIAVYLLIKLLDKTTLSIKIKTIVVNAIGTLVSGVVFLSSALLLTGLPAPFFCIIYYCCNSCYCSKYCHRILNK